MNGGLIGGLLLFLFAGLPRERLTKDTIVKPGQGISLPARNGILIALILGISFGLLYTLFNDRVVITDIQQKMEQQQNQVPYQIIQQLQDQLQQPQYQLQFLQHSGAIMGTIVGLIIGMIGVLFAGPFIYIKHILLKLFLCNKRSIPWNYPDFLDYAAERILLRKVGGGYIFVHRLLLDYFATLDKNTQKARQNYATLLRAMNRNKEAKQLEEQQ